MPLLQRNGITLLYVPTKRQERHLMGIEKLFDLGDLLQTIEQVLTFCFYKIALEGASLREPIWFECDEVELITLPSGVLQEQN